MTFFRRNLANMFTLLNMFLGFSGIIKVMYHDEIAGSYFLIAAAVADLLDGFIARSLKTTSSLGKQLDSFSDLVSFGLLPAFIMHALILRSHQPWVYTWTYLDIPVVSFFPFIIAAAAAIRLAKFNDDSDQKYYFKGLPSPANGLFIASLPLILGSDLYVFGYESIYLGNLILNAYVLLLLSVLLSILMVLNIPLLSFKFHNFNIKQNYPRYLLIILFILLLIFLYYLAIPIIITFYVLLSLVLKNKIITELSTH